MAVNTWYLMNYFCAFGGNPPASGSQSLQLGETVDVGDYLYYQCSPLTLRSKRDLRQVSGVRFQEPNSTRCDGVANDMNSFAPVLIFSCSQISVQD